MKRFIVTGHLASTAGNFSLNDLPGAGRMDVLCRCVNASFFLSHDFRRDVECYLVLCGEPEPPKTVMFSGEKVRYLSPDERSAGSLIKKALALPARSEFRESTPGVYVRKGGLGQVLDEFECAVLAESGQDIRSAKDLPEAYLLSDHHNFSEDEMSLISNLPAYSVGPLSLHGDHTISVLNNEFDRRRAGWH
jgi:Uncharacterized conserved protein